MIPRRPSGGSTVACASRRSTPVAKAMAPGVRLNLREPGAGRWRADLGPVVPTHLPADEAVTCREQILSDFLWAKLR